VGKPSRKQPYIQTGKVDADVMKLRLAKLDITMPVNESGDESNDDDDPIQPRWAASPWIPFEDAPKRLARRRQSN
jgi:hypothetical protein